MYLQIKYEKTAANLSSLGGLAGARGAEVLGAVALVEHDDAVKVLAAPVQQLLQARLVLVRRALKKERSFSNMVSSLLVGN